MPIIPNFPELYDQISSSTLINRRKLKVLYSLSKKLSDIPGHVAELGVYAGGSARLLAMSNPDKRMYAFDTFAGMPWNDDWPEGHQAGEFNVNKTNVLNLLNKHSNIVVKDGIFPDTAQDMGDCHFSLVHLDADIYQSTRYGINFFWPRLVDGGALVFDDWMYTKTWGVFEAVSQYFLQEIPHIRLMIEYDQLIIFKKGKDFMGMELGE